MTTPAPAVRQDGTSPCWEVLRDGEPFGEESNPHFGTHAAAQTWLEELRAELTTDADPLDPPPVLTVDLADPPPVLTVDLADPAPCWIVVCSSCNSPLRHEDGGISHHLAAVDAEEYALDEGWHRGPDGQMRCVDCGPWPDPSPAEDRRPGPGQVALEVGT